MEYSYYKLINTEGGIKKANTLSTGILENIESVHSSAGGSVSYKMTNGDETGRLFKKMIREEVVGVWGGGQSAQNPENKNAASENHAEIVAVKSFIHKPI